MKIILETGHGVRIEIDLATQALTAAIPVIDGPAGEIRIEDGDPPIVHLTLPFGEPNETENPDS